MSVINPEKAGVMLEGVDVRIATIEADLIAGATGVLCTLTSLTGFGAQRATQPNVHMGVLTSAGANFASYITSVIVQQKQFTAELVFTIGADWSSTIQKTRKWFQFTLPPEEGFTFGDGFKCQLEITDWTLKGDIGGRVTISVQLTPVTKMTAVPAIASV